nr:MDIS1-interacting receptor like kinase 2-like [Tanacetum cinerariifolium]
MIQVERQDGKTLEFRAPILVEELLQRYPGAEVVVALLNHHYNYKLKSGNMYYLVPKSSQVSEPRVVNKDEDWGGCKRKRIKVVITKQQLEQLVSNQISIQDVMMKRNQAPCWSKELESTPEKGDDEIDDGTLIFKKVHCNYVTRDGESGHDMSYDIYRRHDTKDDATDVGNLRYSCVRHSSTYAFALFEWKASLKHQNNNSVLPSWTLSAADQMLPIIPSGISNLSILVYLDFDTNHFYGIIPQEIGMLQNLETLHLFENELNGSIPYGICEMRFLSKLALYANTLSGEIPSCLELGNMTSLVTLHASSNFLNGSVPKSIGKLVSLECLRLNNNHFSGPLPKEIGNLKLAEVELTGNSLSGSLPDDIRNGGRL